MLQRLTPGVTAPAAILDQLIVHYDLGAYRA
jgi:hypothetical protein